MIVILSKYKKVWNGLQQKSLAQSKMYTIKQHMNKMYNQKVSDLKIWIKPLNYSKATNKKF